MDKNEYLATMKLTIPPPPIPTKMLVDDYVKLFEFLNSHPEKWAVFTKAFADYYETCTYAAETFDKVVSEFYPH